MSANASPGPTARRCSLEEIEWAAREDRTHGCRLLDARRLDAAPDDHLPGSAWIPWTADRLPAFLLPARGRPLLVFGADAESCARRLASGGWPAAWCDDAIPSDGFRDGPPTGALWDVDPLLVRHLDALPDPSTGPVLDLGCGSSREGIFLAQRGWRVVLVDRLPDALELARARARHHGVEPRIETLARRLRREDDLPEGPFAGALAFRFLQRAVLSGIGSRLAAGGTFVLRSYGQPDAGSVMLGRGPRNPTARLGIDEASGLLGEGWQWVQPPRLVDEDLAVWVTAVGRRLD